MSHTPPGFTSLPCLRAPCRHVWLVIAVVLHCYSSPTRSCRRVAQCVPLATCRGDTLFVHHNASLALSSRWRIIIIMIAKLMFCQGPSANPCWLGVCEVTHVCGCARIARTHCTHGGDTPRRVVSTALAVHSCPSNVFADVICLRRQEMLHLVAARPASLWSY